MKLSLSARVAESFSNKEKASLNLEQLIELARNHGYRALCMRASQAGIHSPPEQVARMSRRIGEAGLQVSMVTGDFAVPRNDELGPIRPAQHRALPGPGGNLRGRPDPHLHEEGGGHSLGAEGLRQRRRAGHPPGPPSPTAPACSRPWRAPSRCWRRWTGSNFGIIYEPANWMIAGEDYGRETIKRLGPHLFNVYVQNHRLNPEGEGVVKHLEPGPGPAGPHRIVGIGRNRFRRGLPGPGGRPIPGLRHRAPGLRRHHVGGRSRPPQRELPRALDGVRWREL